MWGPTGGWSLGSAPGHAGKHGGAGALPGQHPEAQVLPRGSVNNRSLQGLLRRGLSTGRG